MMNYKYLIVGGGMTSAAAAEGIGEVDSTGGIGLISAELDAPYDRPPLSKGLWKGKSLGTIWRRTKDKGVKVHLGRVVKEIVPKQKHVVDDNGDVFTYEKLLLATGGRPRISMDGCRRKFPARNVTYEPGYDARGISLKKNPLLKLERLGQSIWMDFIRRGMISSGELKRLIEEDGLRGMTSNPSIFEKAITGSHDYDDAGGLRPHSYGCGYTATSL